MYKTAPSPYTDGKMKLEKSTSVNIVRALPVHTVDSLGAYEDLSSAPPRLREDDSGLVRSASFTTLVGLTTKGATQDGLKRTFSENVLGSATQQSTKVSTNMQNANIELFRRASRKTKKRMSMVGARRDADNDERSTDSPKITITEEQPKTSTQSVGGTIRNFARRSFMPLTRTESPARKEEANPQKRRNSSPRKPKAITITPIAIPEPVASRIPSRSSPALPAEERSEISAQGSDTASSPPKSKPVKDVHSANQSTTSVNHLSRQSSRTSLGSRASADAMYLEIPSSPIPPLPTSTSSDRLSGTSADTSRKRDPLWTAFRSIEGEWSNFQAKTSLQKAKVVRTILLPFLANNAEDPSNQSLRAEDLDRRVVILNKWWTGLLDLLNGRSNQSISGTDRPAFLEAVLEIMLRSEWRSPPLPSNANAPNPKWTNSVESDSSDFLLETIHQNVRNIFVQNLLSQMAFVVDKLSMRSAPASLVTFSGKTCAYAFFYCPGVADILVRLWHIPTGIVRRLFSEYGTLPDNIIGQRSIEVCQSFPPPVRSLGFSSQSALARHLQPKAQRPAGSETIRWYGPWVNRWIGRDSDLFFVFAKHYHLLVCEFHNAPLSQKDRLCIPGLAAVHAQILIVLESTLYRHTGHFPGDAYAAGDNADAMIPLPMAIPNATRTIGENRLVMMLRDTVHDSHLAYTNFCVLLVESFQLIMKAATRRIPMYNSDASFVLCDLIDEIFPIMFQYERLHGHSDMLDWAFWTKVLQQMVQTETCMTQIRVIAALYNIWPIVVYNESRKRELALNWVLKPTFFNQLFNHWSPMVRHYFYRLLCWRVGRCDGEATELDVEIYQTFASRLNTAWAHHQYLVAEADMRAMCPPSSTPCLPAPGRTLVIIRTDHSPASPSPFATFEKLLSRDQASPYASHSSALTSISEADLPLENVRRKWSIFRNINLFGSSPSNGRPGEVTPPGSPDRGLDKRGGNSGNTSAGPSRPGTPPHQALSFKFSLEHTGNGTRPQMASKSKKTQVPALPTNAQKVLDRLSTSQSMSSESVTRTDILPLKPKQHEMIAARYSGRALAEWAQVVSECRNFYTRRKQEGCPKDSLIETPMMAVEVFKMFS